MNALRLILALLLAMSATVLGAAEAEAPSRAAAPVIVLTLDGPVSPASADYLVRGLNSAAAAEAAAVVIEIDTPGGLQGAMRDVTRAILASPVPVIGYVAPRGARAASAGTFILYACHIAAMAPATNVGAATPVSMIGGNPPAPAPASSSTNKSAEPDAGSAELRKAMNDAVASIRALAERSGRNAEWAEKAVRDAASVSDREALELGVIDLVAGSLEELLDKVQGREVTTATGPHELHVAGAAIERMEPGWHSRFLGVIANPSIAYILLLLGLGGLVMEGMHPGGIVPGVVGGICLLLALYAFQMLPVNLAGLLLIVLGVILIVAEAFVPAFGALGIGGTVALVLGSVILMDTDVPGFQIALPVVVGIALSAAGILAGIVWLALRSRKHPVVSGREEMIGASARAVMDFEGLGLVHLHGERWQARSTEPIRDGDTVRVTGMQGLVLDVRPIDQMKESR